MLDDKPRSSRPDTGQSGDPRKTLGAALQPLHGDDTIGDGLDAAGLRRLLDSTAEGIYQLDMSGRCVFCNAACVRLLGYDSADELIGQRMHELIHHTRRDGSAHPRSACEIYRAFQEGREIHAQDEILWRKDGTWFDVEYWSYPLVQGGERVGSVVTFVDDTDRKRNEDELRRRTEQLEQAKREADAANRTKSDFLANMSHEIRTPMTAILGYADILLSHLDDPDDRQCVETIKRNGKFLVDIINDILDLSKIEAGKLEVERERVAPDELVAEICSLMHVRASEKQLPLLIDYEGELPETIETDPTRLRQVLVNLVGNAIKFTDEGSVRLEVGFVDGAEPRLRFQVIDTGIGIGEQQRETLFEPFSQADSSVTRDFGGTGLGLTISSRLVDSLGGEITVDSTLGEGSTFAMTVGCGALDGVPMVEPRLGITRSEVSDREPARCLNRRVLVVDDRHDIRYLARYFIEQAGGLVEACSNGKEALERVAQAEASGEGFDAIVMDMQMPVMDGYEACKRLRRAGFARPILALTAAAMRGDREKCLCAGCDAHVSKPIDGHHLVELLALHTETAVDSESDAGPEAGSTKTRVLLVDDNRDLSDALGTLLELHDHEVCVRNDADEVVDAAVEFQPHVVLLDIGLGARSGYEVLADLVRLPEMQSATFIALSGRTSREDKKRSLAAGFHHHVGKPVEIKKLIELFDVRDQR
ncbi:MAG: response regulator [Persicimonas sp.]